MYRQALNFLRGSLPVEVKCGFPERVVNLCAGEGVPFWDLQWTSPVTLRLRTTRRGLRQLRRIAGRLGATVKTGRERGAPALLRRFRRRYVLLAALALTALLLVEGNFRIWEFRVSGNETVPEEAILRALEDYGVTIGSRSLHIDQKALRNHVLLELEDVAWLAVNVRGCVARVQVVERVRGDEMVPEDTPCNLVARRAGLVTRVEALGGQAMVEPGSTVTEGQLLISGAVDLDNGGLRWQRSIGRVWARTWYELTASVPLRTEGWGQELSSTRRLALNIGKKRINFLGKGCALGANCDKITQYRALTLPWGLRLPLTLVVETTRSYESVDRERTAREAQAEGEALLRRQLMQLLDEDATVTRLQFEAVEAEQQLLVTLRAECLEQIGQEQPLT